MIRKKQKAFSLIEAAVVILIIGLIIAGITKSSRLVNDARLKNARAMSEGSAISSIKNLIFWFDATNKKSFDENEADNDAKLTNWYDINPQIVKKNNINQSIIDSKPTYIRDAINHLPAVQFDGTDDYFRIDYSNEINPNKLTVFAVVKVAGTSDYGAIFSSRNNNGGTPNKGVMIYVVPGTNPIYQVWNLPGTTTWQQLGNSEVAAGDIDILRLTIGTNETALYRNGTLTESDNVSYVPSDENEFRIGAGRNELSTAEYFFNGYIAELIMYERVLKNDEIVDIEKYLSKKWAINLY
jgi:type II secretory pathway pseudopilin PulG